MTFLSAFQSILHAIEAAAVIAAPIVAEVVDHGGPDGKIIGGLMSQSATTAVMLESAITSPGTGAQKAAAVAAQSQAIIDLTNSLLSSQGKPPLPANTNVIVQASTKSIVDGLNFVAATAGPAAAVPPALPKAA